MHKHKFFFNFLQCTNFFFPLFFKVGKKDVSSLFFFSAAFTRVTRAHTHTCAHTHAHAWRGSLIGRRLQSAVPSETGERTYELDLRCVRRGREGAGLLEIKECKR